MCSDNSKFLKYLYDNKKIKKNSNILIETCSSDTTIKILKGWPSIVFEVTEEHISNIKTNDIEFTAYIITIIQQKDDESLNNLIIFYNNVVDDLKNKNINKKYKIQNNDGMEYKFSEFCYVSPHKPNDWYAQ